MPDDPDLPDPSDETEAVPDEDSPANLGEDYEGDDFEGDDSDEGQEPIDADDPGDEPMPDVQPRQPGDPVPELPDDTEEN